MIALLLAGCVWVTDAEVDAARDRDGDGHPARQWGGDDCDDADADVFPGATEACDATVDQDCDGVIGVDDADGDGFRGCDDCDDTNADVSPSGTETCNDVDDDCDGTVDEAGDRLFFPDDDGDGIGGDGPTLGGVGCDAPSGYADTDGDCDDTDAAINPAAAEICNEVDDDCDGATDDQDDSLTGAIRWYPDSDFDDFGDAAADPTTQCATLFGHVDDDSDCDDADDTIHPGAAESCDGVDQDCDGVVDDDAVDPTVWYTDADGDDFGDDGAVLEACTAPAGSVATGGDCDDGDDTRHPGATEACDATEDANCDGSIGAEDVDGDGYRACEDCDDGVAAIHTGATEICDGVDDDCDGLVDDDDTGVSAASQTRAWPDVDGDGFGDEGDAGTLYCEAPAGFVVDDADCDDARADVNPDQDERCDDAVDGDCDGATDDCTARLADADAIFRGVSAADRAGTAIANAGDTDGDGLDDVIVGAPGTGTAAGTLYVLPGPVTGTLQLYAADGQWNGDADDAAGSSLLGLGDVDGDGNDDVVVGAPGNDAAYLVRGPLSSVGQLRTAATLLSSSVGSDAFGTDLAGGNADGDADPDLFVGAPAAGTGLTAGAGALYGFEGPVTAATLTSATADVTLTGTLAARALGHVVALGDTDGDGTGELFAAGYTDGVTLTGVVYAFDATTSGTESSATAQLDAEAVRDDAGAALDAGGDFDGDGTGDLLIGAPDAGGTGRAYVVFGPIADLALTSADVRFTGEVSGDEAGASVSFLADLDGDGADELLIGAPGTSRAYLFFGGGPTGAVAMADAAVLFDGEGATDEAGAAVSPAGDTDGDGADDLLMGAPGYSVEKGAGYWWGGGGY